MQIYKVKLRENHTAEPDQVTKDGYLADDDGQPFLYKASAARSKAFTFEGDVEKFGKNYTTSEVKMIQFDQKILNPLTVERAKEKLAYTYKKDETLKLPQNMFVCYGNVFDSILEEGNIPAEIVDELKILSVICIEMDYVHFL